MNPSDSTSPLAIGFTAGRTLETFPVAYVEHVLSLLPAFATYITGGCRGGDALIGQWLFHHRPLSRHRVIIPANHSQIDEWWMREEVRLKVRDLSYQLEVIDMPLNTDYRDRNLQIVSQSDLLYAFPAWSEDHPKSLRSGTWQTIRLAHKNHESGGKPYAIYEHIGASLPRS